MGTETQSLNHGYLLYKIQGVKLNDPLMGTETLR